MIIILGAGLTGLSCAYHLGDTSYRLFEAEQRPGGLCRSDTINGFTFDRTGHLLHLRDPSCQKLVFEELLPGVFKKHSRRAFIHSHGTMTPYPFQAHTYGLPRAVVRECVLGYIRAPQIKNPDTFQEWALTTFGEGIYRYFMQPYNEKLWRVPLESLTHEWCSWSIPRPSLEEIIDGAIGIVHRNMGYNPVFWYPRKYGIEVLPAAFARKCRHLETNHRAVKIDVLRRRVLFDNGREESYDRLVSSLPLDELLMMAENSPDEWKVIARGLKRISILAISLGIKGCFFGRKHWVYFPERSFPFYRVGVASNIESTLAPPGCSNLYIEASLAHPDSDRESVLHQCLTLLAALGLKEDPIVEHCFVIPCAYVVYDHFRREAVPAALTKLMKHGILSTGRYGGWKYSYMEQAILDGREAAAWAKET